VTAILLGSHLGLAADPQVVSAFQCLGQRQAYPGAPEGAVIARGSHSGRDGIYLFCSSNGGVSHFYPLSALKKCSIELEGYNGYPFYDLKIDAVGCPRLEQALAYGTKDSRTFSKDRYHLEYELKNYNPGKQAPPTCQLGDANIRDSESQAALKKEVLAAIQGARSHAERYLKDKPAFERIAARNNEASGFGRHRLGQIQTEVDGAVRSLNPCANSEDSEFRRAALEAIDDINKQNSSNGAAPTAASDAAR
jgi:hypothetical protein